MKDSDELMVWTWAGWEPLHYYRRVGGFHEAQEGNALWAEQWFETLHSERTAEALAEAGINWVTTHFFKGFGLAAEAGEIDQTARMIANCHRHGVKVFVYLQYGTIVPETMVDEEPRSAAWPRVGPDGRCDGPPYTYGDQYWRSKPCANQPGFREYLLRCVEKAVAIGADGIWIDNLNSDGCHCDRCQAAFREFLARSVANPLRDLGVRNVANIRIPVADRPRDPVYQQWVRFRCEETGWSLRMIASKARQLNPDILVAANIGLGNEINYAATNGNWLGNLEVLDYCYAENSLFPGVRGEAILSQHFPMKIAAALGLRVVPGAGSGRRTRFYPVPSVPDVPRLRRVFAESAMLGGHAAGGPWGLRGENGGADPILLRDAEYRAGNRRLADAYGAWHRLFAQSTDAAPVAVLHSFEAAAFDHPHSRKVQREFEQLLRRHRIPFRYVLSDRPDGLEGIELLILPHVLPVSDELAECLRGFVRRGGKLLATGRTSLYDEWLRQRTDYALADVFGVSFSNELESASCDEMLVNPANGSIFLPGEWGLQTRAGEPACRVGGDRIVEAIREAVSPRSLPEVLCSSPHVGFEVRRLPEGARLFALLNYGESPVEDVEVRFAGTSAPRTVRAFALDRGEMELPCRVIGDGRTAFAVPALDVEFYAVVNG